MSPFQLRDEANRLRQQEAELRAMSDALRRESDKKALAALEVEAQIRGSLLPPPPLTETGAPSEAAVARSADPDAVEQAAVKRTEATQDERVSRRAAYAHSGKKEARHAAIRDAWTVERELQADADLTRADKAVAAKFKVSRKTVERATKELRASIAK